jgi:hypothetical protein
MPALSLTQTGKRFRSIMAVHSCKKTAKPEAEKVKKE